MQRNLEKSFQCCWKLNKSPETLKELGINSVIRQLESNSSAEKNAKRAWRESTSLVMIPGWLLLNRQTPRGTLLIRRLPLPAVSFHWLPNSSSGWRSGWQSKSVCPGWPCHRSRKRSSSPGRPERTSGLNTNAIHYVFLCLVTCDLVYHSLKFLRLYPGELDPGFLWILSSAQKSSILCLCWFCIFRI